MTGANHDSNLQNRSGGPDLPELRNNTTTKVTKVYQSTRNTRKCRERNQISQSYAADSLFAVPVYEILQCLH